MALLLLVAYVRNPPNAGKNHGAITTPTSPGPLSSCPLCSTPPSLHRVTLLLTNPLIIDKTQPLAACSGFWSPNRGVDTEAVLDWREDDVWEG